MDLSFILYQIHESDDESDDDTDCSLSQCKVNNALWSCSCLLLASIWNLFKCHYIIVGRMAVQGDLFVQITTVHRS